MDVSNKTCVGVQILSCVT
ncbi:hypothetical protein V2J09_018414 [Rumex salicifolius]